MIITLIKAEIEAEAGWAVGTADIDAIGLDRELLTDPDGRPWVPPSSLAGSLRAHLAGHDADERLMGSRPPREDGRRPSNPPPSLTPSALWVLGTRARRAGANRKDRPGGDSGIGNSEENRDGEPPPPRTEVVASTAVDAKRRAALPKSLRHSRIVDEAAVIEFYAALEAKLSDGDKDLLASWQPQVGRDRTRGGGVARLRTLGYRTYDLAQPDDLRAWLETAGPDRFSGLEPIPVAGTADPEVLRAEFLITSALHVGTGSRRGKDKAATVRTRDRDPLVPGSTWKGLFRARAGYIIRNCWGERAACVTQDDCDRQCPICDLFGSTNRRGRIAFRDSTIFAGSDLTKRVHVAIDRISGGGRDQLLFTDEIVPDGRVTLTITRLGPVADWERNLLLHVVRDIHDGLIGVGGGAQRGQGTLQLADGTHAALTSLLPMETQPPVMEAAHG